MALTKEEKAKIIKDFAKNEKENLSKEERNQIRIIVEQIKQERLRYLR